MPPASNSNNFYGVKVSVPGVNVNNATDAQLQYSNNYSQELFYVNGKANVLIGARPANTSNNLDTNEEGFFVAESGVDVRNATDTQLIFNSQQNIFKIVSSGTITVVVADPLASDATSSASVAHGLNITPAFVGYINGTGSSYLTAGTYYQLPFFTYIRVTGIPEPVIYSMTSDATNITAFVTNHGGVGITELGTIVFKYYILQESAA